MSSGYRHYENTQPRLHLEGDYWMERGTHGRIKSVGYHPRLYTTFEAARAAQYRPRSPGGDRPATDGDEAPVG